MEYRYVGKTGLKVSEVSLGAWLTFGGSVAQQGTEACISEAINQGVNFVDIADVYARGEAEKVVGNIMQNYTRKDFVISSKVFWPMSDNINDRGLSRKHIRESIELTLDRLGMDYLDIYFCHRFDRYTPLRETVLAMDDLVRDGLVHYWGTSVWTAAQLERTVGLCREIGTSLPRVEQPRYNMLDRFIELEIMETCNRNGIGLVIWSPLAQGILTGKYNEGTPLDSRGGQRPQFLQRELIPENIAKIKQLGEVAKELDLTTGQLALAWILRRPEITSVITGATKPEHVTSNVKASGVKLDAEVLEKIEQMLSNKPEFHPVYRPPW
ncbi:MAG: aldo/keto reductase family protein [Promethearchaeota archaeon]